MTDRPAHDPRPADKSGEMRDADVANGENPDEQVERTAGNSPADARPDQPHRTGEQQAEENCENELPA
jgi:hypothetical protein